MLDEGDQTEGEAHGQSHASLAWGSGVAEEVPVKGQVVGRVTNHGMPVFAVFARTQGSRWPAQPAIGDWMLDTLAFGLRRVCCVRA